MSDASRIHRIQGSGMITAHAILTKWNALDIDTAAAGILPCCGSLRWARELAEARPFADESALLDRSDVIWLNLSRVDWDEAFRSHPRIGERKAAETATRQSAEWSRQEQGGVDSSDAGIRAQLERGNSLYEERFGRIFLVCASGKTATEMLAILERRLRNDPQTELREAVEQQRQITQLRLRRWLDR
jgi:2-oxo-4-hydroxy-4-carboxy-5-ureidoimidazoline decarboxylase